MGISAFLVFGGQDKVQKTACHELVPTGERAENLLASEATRGTRFSLLFSCRFQPNFFPF